VDVGFQCSVKNPAIKCELFEDNKGDWNWPGPPNNVLKQKHINIENHHFHKRLESVEIVMYATDTSQQQSDIFAKPVPEALFIKLRKL
jgi:hypothetical protein